MTRRILVSTFAPRVLTAVPALVAIAALVVVPGLALPCARVLPPSALPASPQSQPPFRTSVDVVRLDALVLDRGKPLVGLTTRDFEVFDEGVPQHAQVESLEDAPIDVVLALDTSGSVAGALLEHLTAAATALVEAVDGRDRVALLTFSQVLAIGAPLTPDRERVRQALRAVRAGGSTSIVDALSAALSLPGSNGRPTLLLVFSDGVDTASWLTADQVLDQARRSDVVIDGVVVGTTVPTDAERAARGELPADADDLDRFLLRATAATGGHLLDGSRGQRLSGAFTNAVRSFRQRYEITYTPAGSTSPGWHDIDIRVKGHRDATVRARPGYLR